MLGGFTKSGDDTVSLPMDGQTSKVQIERWTGSISHRPLLLARSDAALIVVYKSTVLMNTDHFP